MWNILLHTCLGKCQFPSSTYSLISLSLICISGCLPVDILHHYTASFIYVRTCERYITLPQCYVLCKKILNMEMCPNSSQYIIVSSLLKAPPLTLFEYKYPDWSITVGYIIGFSSFMWIPIYMVYKLVWTPGSLKQVSGWRDGGGKMYKILKTQTSLHIFLQINLLYPLLQRLAVCLRPERTIPDIHADTLNMATVP